MRLNIDHAILEKTLNYLSTQPYREVAALITEIQRDAKPVEEQPKAAEKESNNNDTVSH